MPNHSTPALRFGRNVGYAFILGLALLAAFVASKPGEVDSAAGVTATASPSIAYLNTPGVIFNFTVSNSGSFGIHFVQIEAPAAAAGSSGGLFGFNLFGLGSGVTCPAAPSGWYGLPVGTRCLFYNVGGNFTDIGVGESRPGFQVRTNIGPGTTDRVGDWKIGVGSAFLPLPVVQADPSAPGALTLTVHTFEITDVVVASSAATVNGV